MIHQWKDLNDVFAIGKTEIWYQTPDTWNKAKKTGLLPFQPDSKNMRATHSLLGSIAPCPNGEFDETDLEEIFTKMQGEFWSPNGEARTMIRSRNLLHTSMSVGDCVKLPNNCIWQVHAFGFELIK
jgi:hypothetical protein